MSEIKALLFDMDGLLLDTERLARGAFDRAFGRFGLAPDRALFARLIGLNQATSAGILRRDLPGHVSYEAFEAAWGEEYAQDLAAPIPLRPTVREAIAAVAGRYPLVVATSTRREVAERKLTSTGLRQHFDAMICGDEVQNGKPAPEIFLRAAGLANAAAPHCAAFEDSDNGVRSAHAAGCVVTQIPDLVQPSDALLALGHRTAPDLLSAMRALDLL